MAIGELRERGEDMARLKKNKKNLFTQTFTYKGQRYFARAKERGELSAKVEQKKKDIDAEISKKLTPTLDAYYQNFTEIRRAEVRESTIRAQRFQYELMAAVVVDGVRLGNMEITSIKTDVIEKVRKNLLKEGKLRYKKKGRDYLIFSEDVENYAKSTLLRKRPG